MYRQRMASRTAADTAIGLPPATIFICRPTPSYVVSPQLAGQLKRSDISSLESNLRVYERGFTWDADIGGVCSGVEERDCTPEYFIDRDLSGDQAFYYGHGQIHVVGILDMRRTEVKDNMQFHSRVDLQSRLAREVLRGLPLRKSELSVATDQPLMGSGSESWIVCNTEEAQHKIARAAIDVDHFHAIATALVTLNLAVPISGLDPDRTCPHIRLAAAGIETGPFTSIWARDGTPASDQSRMAHMVGLQGLCVFNLLRAVRRAMGLQQTPTFVDPTRAFGEHDPDLQPDKDAERRWSALERRTREEDHDK